MGNNNVSVRHKLETSFKLNKIELYGIYVEEQIILEIIMTKKMIFPVNRYT